MIGSVGVAFLLLLGTVDRARAEVHIVEAIGTVNVSVDEAAAGEPVRKVPYPLQDGAVVRTGASSSAAVLFEKDIKVVLGAESIFVVASGGPAIKLRLRKGSLRTWLEKLLEGRTFDLEAPGALMSVRGSLGTEFAVNVGLQDDVELAVSKGVVAARKALEEEVAVGDGQTRHRLRIVPDRSLDDEIESGVAQAYRPPSAKALLVQADGVPPAASTARPTANAPGSYEGRKSKCKVVRSDVDTPGYQAKEDPDKYALVIGIENYQNIPDAVCAEHDALAVKENLLALGYPERNIATLVGGRATRSKIVSYVESWYPRNLNENSRLLVYFSGHGAPDPQTKQAYILPWDADLNFLDSSAYAVKTLYSKLNALPAKSILVAMDSCFSGAGGRSVIAEGTRPLVSVKEEKIEGKLVVFSAASAGEITGFKNDQGHGLFTYYFLKGLNGEAEDKKAHGITLKSLAGYIESHVVNAARRDNREQHPLFHAGASQESLLRDTSQ